MRATSRRLFEVVVELQSSRTTAPNRFPRQAGGSGEHWRSISRLGSPQWLHRACGMTVRWPRPGGRYCVPVAEYPPPLIRREEESPRRSAREFLGACHLTDRRFVRGAGGGIRWIEHRQTVGPGSNAGLCPEVSRARFWSTAVGRKPIKTTKSVVLNEERASVRIRRCRMRRMRRQSLREFDHFGAIGVG